MPQPTFLCVKIIDLDVSDASRIGSEILMDDPVADARNGARGHVRIVGLAIRTDVLCGLAYDRYRVQHRSNDRRFRCERREIHLERIRTNIRNRCNYVLNPFRAGV